MNTFIAPASALHSSGRLPADARHRHLSWTIGLVDLVLTLNDKCPNANNSLISSGISFTYERTDCCA